MKKLPVLLLILTVVAMPVRGAWALEDGAEQGTKMELPVVHAFDPLLHIREIRPREGLVEIEVDSPIGRDLQVKRVWIASFDYEKGWTEEEVDGRLDEWTVLEVEWAKVTKEQVLPNMASHSYATIPLNIGESRLQYDLTEVNWPDILYYAAEFKDLEDETAEPIWVKGKADYRGCAHASAFQNWETGICEEVVDWGNMTAKYLPAGATEDERVITWEEEWRLKLAGRLDNIGAILDGLVMALEMSEEVWDWNLAQEEEKLTAIEGLLAKATGAEAETARAAALRARIETLREREFGGEGNDLEVGGGNGETGDSTGGEEGPTGGEGSGNGSSGEDIGGGVSGGALGDGSGDASGGVATGGEADGESIGEVLGVVSGEGLREEANGGGEGKDEANEELKEDFVDRGEVEVPKLGEAKSRNGWIWWVLGVSGALAVVFGVILKRKQREDRQR